ncbi:MAG TPA: hypothetical protein VIF37_07415 [Methylobacter sp.]
MIALILDVRTEANVAALEADLEQALPDRFHERTGKLISFATVKRWLKERHWVWKRCRRSIKAQCDPALFDGRPAGIESLSRAGSRRKH